LFNTDYTEKTSDEIEKISSGYWRNIFPKFSSVPPALRPAGFHFLRCNPSKYSGSLPDKNSAPGNRGGKGLALFFGLFSPQPKERQKGEAGTAIWNFGPSLKGAEPYTAAAIYYPLIPVVLIIRFRIGGIHG